MILVFGLKFWLKVTTNPSYIRYMLVKNEPEQVKGRKYTVQIRILYKHKECFDLIPCLKTMVQCICTLYHLNKGTLWMMFKPDQTKGENICSEQVIMGRNTYTGKNRLLSQVLQTRTIPSIMTTARIDSWVFTPFWGSSFLNNILLIISIYFIIYNFKNPNSSIYCIK